MYKDLFVLWHYVCVDEYKHTMTPFHDPPQHLLERLFKNRCVFVHLMLCMKERDSEKERCCICFSLKGANERVFLLVEWGS